MTKDLQGSSHQLKVVGFRLWQTAQAAPAKAAATDLAEKVDFSNVKIEPIFEEMVDFETICKNLISVQLRSWHVKQFRNHKKLLEVHIG